MHIKELVENYFNKISDFYSTKVQDKINIFSESIPTGLYDFDAITGGLRKDQFIIIGSRPSMGKTSLLTNIVTNVALKEKKTILFFSLHLNKKDLTIKVLSSVSEINSRVLINSLIDKYEFSKVIKAMSELSSADMYIEDNPRINLETIIEKIKEVQSKTYGTLIVAIDDLQMLAKSTEQIEICRQLKILSRELGVSIILTSQLNPWSERRGDNKPRINDLAVNQSDIANFADIVLLLYREEYYNPNSDKRKLAELIIAKNNMGETGTIELYFDQAITTFASLEKA